MKLAPHKNISDEDVIKICGHENLVYDDMVERLNCIDDAYKIEKEIAETERKLKHFCNVKVSEYFKA